MTPPDDRRTITAGEAARQIGVPSGSIRSWASRGLLFAVSIGPNGERWYLLSEVLQLANTRHRRKAHRRPNRCLTPTVSDIA